MTEATLDTPEAVLAEARSLAAQSLSALVGRLAALRSRYREAPELFTEDTLAVLREVAGRTKPVAASSAHEPALSMLRDVFGYPSFRPGQQQIIETLLAGRDCVGVDRKSVV